MEHAGPPADCAGPPPGLSAMSEAIKPMTQGAATTTQRAQARHRQVCSGVAVPFGLAPRSIVVSTTLRTRLDHAFDRTEPTSPGLRAGDGHLVRSSDRVGTENSGGLLPKTGEYP